VAILALSSAQAINDNSPYALYPSRLNQPPELKPTHHLTNTRRHNSPRRNHRDNLVAPGGPKTRDSRIAFSSDTNLQRDYIATTVGKEIQLDCKIKDLASDGGKIVWLKMPKGEILTLNGNRVTQEQRVSAKCVQGQAPCWSLVIQEVRETDTGFYVCQTNSMQTKYVYLDVMVPPKLLTNYPVDRIDVNRSAKARIECEFYGKPEPLIKWYRREGGNQKEIGTFKPN
jgi:hypothetical protein